MSGTETLGVNAVFDAEELRRLAATAAEEIAQEPPPPMRYRVPRQLTPEFLERVKREQEERVRAEEEKLRLVQALEEVAKSGDVDIAANALFPKAGVVRDFVRQWFTEVQGIICGKEAGAMARTADISAKGVATALAAWITSSLGLTSPMATGLAVMVLLVVSKATKDAFCRMTAAEADKLVGEQARQR